MLNSSFRSSLGFSLIIFAAFVAGCASRVSSNPPQPNPTPNPNPTPAAFSVASVVPAAGTTQVATSATVQVTFSSAADASTVNATNIQVAASKPIAGAVTYNSTTNTATFTPSAALAQNSTFTVTVIGVASSAGTAMTAPFTSTFATVNPTPPPTTQFQATLFAEKGPTLTGGQVTIDTTGNTTITLRGAEPSTSFSVQFFPAADATLLPPAPFTVLPSFSTDAHGNASVSGMFPQSGNWAGDFSIQSQPSGSVVYATDLGASPTYSAILLPLTQTNAHGVTKSSPQLPLTSGMVAYSKGSLVFTVTGASASTSYGTSESETTFLNSSGTYMLSSFTTDAQGNGSSTTQLSGSGGDLFEVVPQSGTSAGYIGGFSVPKQ